MRFGLIVCKMRAVPKREITHASSRPGHFDRLISPGRDPGDRGRRARSLDGAGLDPERLGPRGHAHGHDHHHHEPAGHHSAQHHRDDHARPSESATPGPSASGRRGVAGARRSRLRLGWPARGSLERRLPHRGHRAHRWRFGQHSRLVAQRPVACLSPYRRQSRLRGPSRHAVARGGRRQRCHRGHHERGRDLRLVARHLGPGLYRGHAQLVCCGLR